MKTVHVYRYEIYLTSITSLAFFSHVLHMDVYAIIPFFLIGLGIIHKTQNIMYLLGLMFAVIMASPFSSGDTNTALMSGLLAVLFIIDFVKYRRFTTLGSFGLPLILLIDATLISWFNAPSIFVGFAGFVLMVIIFILYVYTINSLDAQSSNVDAVIKLYIALSVLVTAQLIYRLMIDPDPFMTVLFSRRIHLGWASLDDAIIPNILTIPFVAYLIFKNEKSLHYMGLQVIIVAGVFLTMSHSALFSLFIYMLLILPLMIKRHPYRKRFLSELALITGVVVLFLGFIEWQYSAVSMSLQHLATFDYSVVGDHIDVLKLGISAFLDNIILGTGGIYSMRHILEDAGYTLKDYQNTFVTTTSLGLLGIIAFTYLQVKKVKLVLKIDRTQRFFMFVLLFVTILINGFFKPMYYHFLFMFQLFLLLATLEFDARTKTRSN